MENEKSTTESVPLSDEAIAKAKSNANHPDLKLDITAKARQKAEKKAKKDEPKGPGVIASILEFVTKAGKKGISKESILTKLTTRFPERVSEGMSKTINVQLPVRMSRERKVKIVKLDNGKFQLKVNAKKAEKAA